MPGERGRPDADDFYDVEYDGGFDPDDEDATFDCALGPDGQCGKAGSEECDFECPMRDSEHFAGSKAWKRERRG